jgi:hypothetical protein
MIQPSFLIEASFIALTAIVVGTGLAPDHADNIVNGTANQASWQDASWPCRG